MKRTLVLVFLFSTIYAVLRYQVFGPVLTKDIFLYTFNKIIIFSAVLLMFFGIISPDKNTRNFFGKWVVLLIFIHILSSLNLLNPYYFPDFFIKGKGFSTKANLVLLGGVLGAGLIFLRNKKYFSEHIYKYLFFSFISLHLISMGFQGWISPLKWHGFMPPITLLSFLILLLWLVKKK